MILNRYGDIIFETDNIDQPWDGKFNGADATESVYVYQVYYWLPYQKPVTKTGTITVLR